MKRGMSDAYATLIERVKEIGRLEAVEQLLDWDQETYMPPKGVTGRADLAELERQGRDLSIRLEGRRRLVELTSRAERPVTVPGQAGPVRGGAAGAGRGALGGDFI